MSEITQHVFPSGSPQLNHLPAGRYNTVPSRGYPRQSDMSRMTRSSIRSQQASFQQHPISRWSSYSSQQTPTTYHPALTLKKRAYGWLKARMPFAPAPRPNPIAQPRAADALNIGAPIPLLSHVSTADVPPKRPPRPSVRAAQALQQQTHPQPGTRSSVQSWLADLPVESDASSSAAESLQEHLSVSHSIAESFHSVLVGFEESERENRKRVVTGVKRRSSAGTIDTRDMKRPPRSPLREVHAKQVQDSVEEIIRFSERSEPLFALDTIFEQVEQKAQTTISRPTQGLHRTGSFQASRIWPIRPTLSRQTSSQSFASCVSEQHRASEGALSRYSLQNPIHDSSPSPFFDATENPWQLSQKSSRSSEERSMAASESLLDDAVLVDADPSTPSEVWSPGFGSVPLSLQGVTYLQSRSEKQVSSPATIVRFPRRRTAEKNQLRMLGFWYTGTASSRHESRVLIQALKDRGVLDAKRRLSGPVTISRIFDAIAHSPCRHFSLAKQTEVFCYLEMVAQIAEHSD